MICHLKLQYFNTTFAELLLAHILQDLVANDLDFVGYDLAVKDLSTATGSKYTIIYMYLLYSSNKLAS